MSQLSEVQKTILNQVHAAFLQYRMVVTDGPNTLHFKNRSMKKTVTVAYNAGLDLYEVSHSTLDKDYNVKTKDIGPVYWDQLPKVWF